MKKYNRTGHLPCSQELTSDDKRIPHINNLLGREIIMSEKLDGGNTMVETYQVFERSHAMETRHGSCTMLKGIAAVLHSYGFLKEGFKVFGENLQGIHSIVYNKLPFPFFLFAIYNDGEWLSWDEIEDFSKKTKVPTVPVLFRGIIKTEKELTNLVLKLMKEESALGGKREGVVVRVASRFKDHDFETFVGKSVRKGHVQTDEHWKVNWKQADIDPKYMDIII
jgi:hypothetical protein